MLACSAFAHKGGVHVSAVLKEAATYEHVPAAAVGNLRIPAHADRGSGVKPIRITG